MALTDNLVAFWKLDEASGTRNDSVGSNHLTDNNTVTQAVGKVGNAAQFTAANSEWLSRASDATLQPGASSFTYSLWLYRDSFTGGNILDFRGSGNGFSLYNPSPLVCQWYTDAGTFASSVSLSDSAWFHVICGYDDSIPNIFVVINNGTPDTQGVSTTVWAPTADFTLGRYSGGGAHFDGRIDAVGFWKRVLTSDERTTLYNGGSGLEYPFTISEVPSPLLRSNKLRPRFFAPGLAR